MLTVLPKEPWYALYLSFCCQHGQRQHMMEKLLFFNNMIDTLKVEH